MTSKKSKGNKRKDKIVTNPIVFMTTNYITILILLLLVWLCHFSLYNNIPYSSILSLYRLILVGRLYNHYYYNKDHDKLYDIPLKESDEIDKVTEDNIITTIPPIIHYFSKYNKIPSKWLASHSSMLAAHTQIKRKIKFTFKSWGDEQLEKFISDEFPWFLDIYNSYPYNIQRIDVARYFVLRKYGGLYIDLDIGSRRDVTDFITSKYGVLLPKTAPFGISNDLMFSTPSHPFFIYVTENLHYYKDFHLFFSKFITVMSTTGSIFLSLMFYKYKNILFQEQINNILYDNITSRSDIMLFHNILDVGLINRKDYEQSYFYHLPGNSWQGLDGMIIISLWKYRYFILMILFLGIFCKQAYIHGDYKKEDNVKIKDHLVQDDQV